MELFRKLRRRPDFFLNLKLLRASGRQLNGGISAPRTRLVSDARAGQHTQSRDRALKMIDPPRVGATSRFARGRIV